MCEPRVPKVFLSKKHALSRQTLSANEKRKIKLESPKILYRLQLKKRRGSLRNGIFFSYPREKRVCINTHGVVLFFDFLSRPENVIRLFFPTSDITSSINNHVDRTCLSRR